LTIPVCGACAITWLIFVLMSVIGSQKKSYDLRMVWSLILVYGGSLMTLQKGCQMDEFDPLAFAFFLTVVVGSVLWIIFSR
jgi:hypothetical protein